MATMAGLSSYRLPVLFSASETLFSSLQGVSKNIQTSDKKYLSTESAEKPTSCIVLSGPSGVGKSTFIRKLLHDYPDVFGFSISHTTRLPREHEKDGISYYFISKERFLEDVANGKFIEYAQVHGNFYGTSFDSVKQVIDSKKICLLDLDIQGVEAVKKSMLRATFIWIAAPSMEDLESRLRNRKSENEESIQRRLCSAKEEILFALRSGIFDYTVMNDDIDRAYEDLKSLLRPYI
ncbi:Guanylate kinase 1 [Galdieria sulphuraria]|nr:Guanylate kinase 1 [Galdieria sulphuraria]